LTFPAKRLEYTEPRFGRGRAEDPAGIADLRVALRAE
jgi:hypothetical protein